jgi:hypothetical protein
MGTKPGWTRHDLEMALAICSSTTELCHFLYTEQSGPQTACIRRYAERWGLEWLPAKGRHGDGREREPWVVPLGKLRAWLSWLE